jgi:hypothetical protein
MDPIAALHNNFGSGSDFLLSNQKESGGGGGGEGGMGGLLQSRMSQWAKPLEKEDK